MLKNRKVCVGNLDFLTIYKNVEKYKDMYRKPMFLTRYKKLVILSY